MAYNRLEDTIKKLYIRIGLKNPNELDAEIIADRLDFSVYYINGISKYIDAHKTFYITKRASPQEQWQQFGHELCHALWHSGNQLNMKMDWRLYQEWQANSFAFEACVPRYLLEKVLQDNPTVHPVPLISEQFGVTEKFAETRYSIHTNRLSQKQRDLLQFAGLY